MSSTFSTTELKLTRWRFPSGAAACASNSVPQLQRYTVRLVRLVRLGATVPLISIDPIWLPCLRLRIQKSYRSPGSTGCDQHVKLIFKKLVPKQRDTKDVTCLPKYAFPFSQPSLTGKSWTGRVAGFHHPRSIQALRKICTQQDIRGSGTEAT